MTLSPASSRSGSFSLAAEGEAALTGAVTLSEGAGITLTQVGQDIEIAGGGASGGSILLPAIAAPIDPRLLNNFAAFGANVIVGARVVIPTTGTLHDFAVCLNASADNVAAAIYDTALTTRNRLWTSGSVAAPASGTWRVVGDPNMAVVAGEQYDFVFGSDGNTVAVGRATIPVEAQELPAAFTLGQAGDPKMCWAVAASYPPPATIAEASLAATGVMPCYIARIT